MATITYNILGQARGGSSGHDTKLAYATLKSTSPSDKMIVKFYKGSRDLYLSGKLSDVDESGNSPMILHSKLTKLKLTKTAMILFF